MIETIVFWLLILFCTLYILIHILLWKGLNRLSNPKLQTEPQNISVIIAARNEENTIAMLLQSLIDQNYPADKFEIIIANDRSTDSTSSIIQTFVRSHNNVRLINIESNTGDMPGKKNALRAAIEQSRFEILAFTDADCVVPKNWLNEISIQFSDDVGAVTGYSPYFLEHTSPVVSAFLRYEEYKNSLIAAAAVGLEHAFLCTGRNFAYRKKAYEQVGGYEKIKHSISGDDDLFLQLLRRETMWTIRNMISAESYVRTYPPHFFSQFVNQRTRHVSGSKFYPKNIQFTYALIHFFHLALIAGLYFAPLLSLIVLMAKFNVDGAFIAKGKNIFNEEFSVTEFFVSESLLVLYSFLIAPLGLVKNFDWKGSQNR